MPNRAKPKIWRRPTFDTGREADAIYTSEVLAGIVALADIEDDARAAQLGYEILGIARWYRVEKRFEDRPTPRETRAALDRLEKQLTELRQTTKSIDDDTLQRLRRAASGQSHDLQKEPPAYGADIPNKKHPAYLELTTNLGDAYISELISALKKASRVTARARRALPQKGRGGRPRKTSQILAVRALAHAWQDAKGEAPTRRYVEVRGVVYGPFHDFVRAFFAPEKIKVSDDMIRRAIAESENWVVS